MPRKKKVKTIDLFLNALKKKMDDASIRDLLYLGAYFSAVYFIYDFLTGHPLPIQLIESFIVIPLGLPQIKEPKKPKGLDHHALAKALVAAYIVLKIDVEDVVSATKALGSVVAGLTA